MRFTLSHRSRLSACLVALLALSLGACSTTITARHSPLYRAIPHASEIRAEATNNQSGIETIALEVTRGTMTDCTEFGVPPSVFPCRSGAVTTTFGCGWGPGNPSTAACTAPLSLGNRELVTYTASARPGTGSSRTTPTITYAGGIPPAAFMVRPIWWHRGQSLAGKIDLGFFPDADYNGFYTTFTDDLEELIVGTFFNSSQNFAQIYTLFRETHNLWAAPFGADAQGCSRTFNSSIGPVSAAVDGQAIIHQDEFRDCASIALGGAGSVWAGAGDPDWILVHESGHFLHGQGDEYCCDGGYAFADTCGNVFNSQNVCQTYATSNGFQPGRCTEIASGGTQTGKWRIDDGDLETMRNRTDNSNFRNTSLDCVIDRFVACGDGNCY